MHRRMGTVHVGDLASGSAIEMVRGEGGAVHSIVFSPESPPLELVRATDVLYVPSALDTGQSLQILRGRFVPVEAVIDEFVADFVKERVLARGAQVFEGFVPCEHSGEVCVLGNVFSRNFTHFHEELMKVVVLERAGIDCAYVLSELPAFARELLTLLGVGADRILEVRGPTSFRSALFSTPVSYRNASNHPRVLLALREQLLSGRSPRAPAHGCKLWLDRGEQTRLGRRLVNQDEVHTLLEKYGFERVDMGALTVAEQVSVAAGARAMAGLHGSQFVHTQLMPAGSWVVECFSPLYLNPTYTEIYRVLRHRYAQICDTNTPVFPYRHGADVRVDCQQLDLALSAASEELGA
jgi:hypothetical protein